MPRTGGSRKHWSRDEKARLRQLFPGDPWEDLLRALPGRSDSAIWRKAQQMKLSRHVFYRHQKRFIHPIFEILRQARYEAHTSVHELARAIGCSHVTLNSAECGRSKAGFDIILAWAQTLGFELVLRRVGQAQDLDERVSDLIEIDRTENVIRNGQVTSERLSRHELLILSELIAHAPGLRTKEQLHHAVYADDEDGGAQMKIIDVRICRIRQKVAATGLEIITNWGQGYFARVPKRRVAA